MDDRHARHRRTPPDRRRRPRDGFRASSRRRFEQLVADALDSLPAELATYVENVAVVVEDVPPADVLDAGDEVLLGLYQGVPRTERYGDPAALPDHITIYRRPIESRVADREELADLVREVVVHEIAHHFGIDDDRLDELGW